MSATFIHIPKTGGTSQISVLKKYNIKIYDYLDSKIADINEHDFKWTFVRNPFDRLASTIGAWRWKNINKTISQILDLAELGSIINWKLPLFSKEIRSTDYYQNSDMSILYHIMPMHVIINKIKEHNNININYIARFENIDNDWNFIKEKINISDDLPRLNYSKHRPYQKYFNRKKFIDRVVSLYKQDFIDFNYPTNI
jgi:type I site-specific restriction endonuclease